MVFEHSVFHTSAAYQRSHITVLFGVHFLNGILYKQAFKPPKIQKKSLHSTLEVVVDGFLNLFRHLKASKKNTLGVSRRAKNVGFILSRMHHQGRAVQSLKKTQITTSVQTFDNYFKAVHPAAFLKLSTTWFVDSLELLSHGLQAIQNLPVTKGRAMRSKKATVLKQIGWFSGFQQVQTRFFACF